MESKKRAPKLERTQTWRAVQTNVFFLVGYFVHRDFEIKVSHQSALYQTLKQARDGCLLQVADGADTREVMCYVWQLTEALLNKEENKVYATVIIIVAGISKKKMKNSGFKSNDDLSSEIYYTFFNISNPNNGTSFKVRRYIVIEFLIANFLKKKTFQFLSF